LISDGFERRLTVEERMEIRDHLQTCAACAAFERSTHAGLEAIRRLPDITPSPRLWESVHTLTALQPRATPKRVAHQALGIAGAALVVALVAVVTILLFNNHVGMSPSTPHPAFAPAPPTASSIASVPATPRSFSTFIKPATPTGTPPASSTQAATAAASSASTTPATVDTTPEPPTLDATAAENFVVSYFHSINLKDYATAYSDLGSNLQQLQSYSNFADGYADTVKDTVTPGKITSQGNDVAVQLHLDAEQADGTMQRYDGTYVVGIEENVLKIVDATVTEEASGTPVASAAVNTTTCIADDLTASASYQGATGSMVGSIIFTYGGSGSCVLAGTPTIQILDADGQPLKITQVALSLGATQKPVTLEKGQQASLAFTWSNWCAAGTSDTATATPDSRGFTLAVTLASGSKAMMIPVLNSDGTPITAVPRCDSAQAGSTLSVGEFTVSPNS
jgi:hypothetical protein